VTLQLDKNIKMSALLYKTGRSLLFHSPYMNGLSKTGPKLSVFNSPVTLVDSHKTDILYVAYVHRIIIYAYLRVSRVVMDICLIRIDQLFHKLVKCD